MATQAHCAYCFESLVASFERRQPLTLAETEDLWEQYHATKSGDPGDVAGADEHDDDAEMTEAETEEPVNPKPAAISRLLNRGTSNSKSAASSSSSLPSTPSTGSSAGSKTVSGTSTPASSLSSRDRLDFGEEFPLFVTWNTISKSGHKSLRGCIGTFEAQELGHGLRSYALTSAFEDVRFQPIPASLLPQLSASVTLLTDFSTPSKDPLDWTLGKHGIRISFTHHSRRYGATYLPDVASEQGWTKDETLISLMRKAGWNGSSSSWQKVWRDGKGELVTYEGKQIGLKYPEWREWRAWVDESGVKSKALN